MAPGSMRASMEWIQEPCSLKRSHTSPAAFLKKGVRLPSVSFHARSVASASLWSISANHPPPRRPGW
eukprot:8663966-Heterocapsa_arctica.AAC.1